MSSRLVSQIKARLQKMVKASGGRRARRPAHRRRVAMMGGVRRMSGRKVRSDKGKHRPLSNCAQKWIDLVRGIYREEKSYNPNYTYKQALKDASKVYQKGSCRKLGTGRLRRRRAGVLLSGGKYQLKHKLLPSSCDGHRARRLPSENFYPDDTMSDQLATELRQYNRQYRRKRCDAGVKRGPHKPKGSALYGRGCYYD